MSARIFLIVNACRECPERYHFSGGRYECMQTRTIIADIDALPGWCPLPHYPTEVDALRARVAELEKKLKPTPKHGGECLTDEYARAVCEGMYADKCDDVIELCAALRAVYALAGENLEVRGIVEKAIAEHGGPDVA